MLTRVKEAFARMSNRCGTAAHPPLAASSSAAAPNTLASRIDYGKIDMVLVRVLMMCGWLSMLYIAGSLPTSA